MWLTYQSTQTFLLADSFSFMCKISYWFYAAETFFFALCSTCFPLAWRHEAHCFHEGCLWLLKNLFLPGFVSFLEYNFLFFWGNLLYKIPPPPFWSHSLKTKYHSYKEILFFKSRWHKVNETQRTSLLSTSPWKSVSLKY